MKLKYIFTSLVAALGLMAVSCTPETQYQLSEIQVSSSYIAIPAEGGNVEITLTAQDAWEFASVVETGKDADNKPILAQAPTWLTITPLSGSAGEATVKFHADAAEATREASLQISCAGKTQRISVIQMTEAVEPTILSVSEVIAMAPGLAAGTIPEQTIYVRGIVSKIDEISTSYGNATFYLSDDGTHKGSYNSDGTGDANWFEVYRGYWLNGAKFTKGDEFSVGDELVVTGLLMSYKGTPETNQNTASVVSIKKSLITMSAPDFTTIPAEGLEFELAISAKATPLMVTTDASWLKVTDVKNDPKKGDIYVFTAEANDTPKTRKATITVKAPGALKSIDLTQDGLPVQGATTIAGILEQISSTSSSAPDALTATLTGAVVSYVNGNTAYIEDETAAIKLYKSGHGLKAGDVLSGEVTGSAYIRNGVPQMTEFTGYSVAIGGTIPLTEITIEALLANYDANLNRRVIIKGVTVTDGVGSNDRNGTIEQSGSTIALYDESKATVLEKDASGDLIAYVSKYNATKQLSVWQSSDFTKAGPSFAIDGNFDEWADIPEFASEQNSRIRLWKFASDANNVYFYFKLRGDRIGKKMHIAFDTDNNEATGSTVGNVAGAEVGVLTFPVAEGTETFANGFDPLTQLNGTVNATLAKWAGGMGTDGEAYVELSMSRSTLGLPASGTIAIGCAYDWYVTGKQTVTL